MFRKVANGLLTFFLVFYSVQCFQRFYTLYERCVFLGGSLMEWVSLVRTHLDCDAESEWNATRYMLGALCVHYAEVTRNTG